MKKYFIVSILMIAAFAYNAGAAVKVKNNTANRYEEQMASNNSAAEMEDADAIAILENDIRILDEEIAKCKKQKKGWIAATVIGAAGVVATGTAAAVQGVKISDKKGDLKEKKDELKDKKDQLKQLDNKIKQENGSK